MSLLRPTRGTPTALASLGPLLLAGCTIVQPVPDAAQSGRISTLLQAEPATDGRPATAACAADDRQYAGQLGVAICEVDRRRLQYLRLGAQVLNGNAAWNALLWPLSAAALYEAARGGGSRSLLLPAAGLGAAYGVMQAGIPERQQQYLAAARRLGCTIVAASADLYRQQDLAGPAGPGDPPPLQESVAGLSAALTRYEAARLALLAGLQPRSAVVQRPGNFVEAIDARHRGALGGSTGADSRAAVQAHTLAVQLRAQAVLQAGQALQHRLLAGDAGWQLRMQAARVDADLQADLARRAPPPAEPGAVLASLARSNAQLVATLQAGDPRGGADTDPALPSAALAGLDAASGQRVQDFQREQTALLATAMREVAAWTARHDAQRATVERLLQAHDCAAGLVLPGDVRAPAAQAPAIPPPDLPDAAAAAGRGARPSTSNTAPQVAPLPR